ncbi:transposase family protein [Actinoplanes sp. NPDC051411]|uniref:transposase family protein n=1 Tax=Actinoplanes sp. NPDC051411 TaxID=3155522 RepID=UPI00343697E2
MPWARPGARHTTDFENVAAWLTQRMDKAGIARLLCIRAKFATRVPIPDALSSAIRMAPGLAQEPPTEARVRVDYRQSDDEAANDQCPGVRAAAEYSWGRCVHQRRRRGPGDRGRCSHQR